MATRYSGSGPRKDKTIKGSTRNSKPRKTKSKTTHSF